jgi:hypothetical protein
MNLLGTSAKEILSTGTPLGIVHVWEYLGTNNRARFFYSLDWKISKHTYDSWFEFGLNSDMGFMWKCDALKFSKELVNTISTLSTSLVKNEASTHPYKHETEKRIQQKLDNIRKKYDYAF